jgi:hypothetical protein
MNRLASASVALAPILVASCGDRPDVWNESIRLREAHGLADAVAIVDDSAHRVVLAAPENGDRLGRSSVAVGPNVLRTAVSRDRSTLFVLSAGEVPRKRDDDEKPALHVISRSAGATTTRVFPLQSALSGMTVDPLGRFVALHASTDAADATGAPTAFVENPNELVLIDLERADAATAIEGRTLRSFGGKPRRLTFTAPLSLPGGFRRLLVVETEQDVAILDLDHVHDRPERPEITVRLGSGSTSKVLRPAGLVVDDGAPDRNDDARIAIRAESDPSVVTLTLGPAGAAAPGITPPPNPNDFTPTVNLVDVGGPASDLAFVRTDGGLRLAAIVPGIASAVLIEPETGLTDRVALPASYQRLSLITRELAAPADASSDVALLWAGNQAGAGVAFWSLGKTAGQPYRSVEVVSVGGSVAAVSDVPPPRTELKLLGLGSDAGRSSFVVLDLRARTAAPLITTGQGIALEVAADGGRAWAYQRGTTKLASVSLPDARPLSLELERAVDVVYDVANRAGTRSLLAIHDRGAVGITLLDALAPDPTRAVSYSGLLLEGLP